MKLKLNEKQKEYFNFDIKDNVQVKVDFMESFSDFFKKGIEYIDRILKQYNISYTIIGGIARNQYGIRRTTEDIDIVVSEKDKDKMLNIPIGYMKDVGRSEGKVFKVHDPGVKLEVIYSGEVSGDGIRGLEYLEPKKISKEIDGIPYITLVNLIRYKLSSGLYANRLKDFADIQDLIKVNNLSRDYADSFREDLKNKYVEIWDM